MRINRIHSFIYAAIHSLHNQIKLDIKLIYFIFSLSFEAVLKLVSGLSKRNTVIEFERLTNLNEQRGWGSFLGNNRIIRAHAPQHIMDSKTSRLRQRYRLLQT